MGDTPGPPAVLVGILHVGESSLPRVLDRIHAQVDVAATVLEVAHLPERAAHARLYEAFDGAEPHFDALVKVDADMELLEPRLLHAIGALFRRHTDLDHVLLGVDDWFSGRRIQGLSAWRNGVRWTSPPPELFTDLPANTARTKLKVMDAGRPLVLHAADPSDLQAARYGLHRGLKAVATGKASRILRLREVVDHAIVAPERGRLVAVAAIGLALRDRAQARALLDATGDEDADLTAVLANIGDPDLCMGALQAVGDLAASAERASASRAPASQDPGLVTRAVRAARTRLSSARERRGGPTGPNTDELRKEFLALLDVD